jgi:hypothetical protein
VWLIPVYAVFLVLIAKHYVVHLCSRFVLVSGQLWHCKAGRTKC